MNYKRNLYCLISLPIIITICSLFFLPSEVALRYSRESIHYGSKYALLICPILALWLGVFELLVGKIVEKTDKTQKEEIFIKRITYIPLIIINVITVIVLLGAFVK